MRCLARKLFVIAIVVSAAAVTAAAQITEEEFRAYLSKKATINSDELAELDRGGIVVKAIPASDKQEVAVVGVVRVKQLPTVTLRDFRDSLSPKSSKEMDAKGRFSNPPVIGDLADLELEERDFKELRKCIVGDCDVNMSADWIDKFGKGLDWTAPDHKQKATELFREMLLQYAGNYSTGGTELLGEYANRKDTVSLSRSHRSLIANALFLDVLAPELLAYLKEFPKKELSGVESSTHWSNIDFGLNPTVTLSHSAAFTNSAGDHFVAARQFYSSRYLDASLSLTMLLRFSDGVTYIVFSDRSRSDALEGIFHGMSKRVVEAEAIERVKNLLKNSELRLITANRPQMDVNTPAAEISSKDRVLTRLLSPLGIVGAIVVLLLIAYAAGRSISRKQK